MNDERPWVLAITGATGVVYGVELLRVLHRLGHAVHLIVTEAARQGLRIEMGLGLDDLRPLATAMPHPRDIAAPVASGSFRTRGMLVAPCTIKSLSGIAHSYADNLVVRAADVCLKERRPLVLMVRETPLHRGHLELMLRAADLGAILLPPMPAFYTRPQTLDDIVRHGVGKALDLVGVEHDLYPRWSEQARQEGLRQVPSPE